MTDTSEKSVQLSLAIAVLALVIALMSFVWPGDGKSEEPDTSNNLSKIKIAVVPAPPVSLFDAGTDTAEGHAVDVMNEIAKRSGIEVEYFAGNWATMGASLKSDQADLVLGPIFMSEDRAREFAFTHPIYQFSIVPVVRQDEQLIATKRDLARDGLKVAVGRGGFDAQFVSRNLPNAIVSEFPPDDPNLSMLEVQAGRADLAIVDYATAVRFAKENPEVRVLDSMPLSNQYAGFMVDFEDERLREFLNIALRNLSISSELDAISQQYDDVRIWHSLISTQ